MITPERLYPLQDELCWIIALESLLYSHLLTTSHDVMLRSPSYLDSTPAHPSGALIHHERDSNHDMTKAAESIRTTTTIHDRNEQTQTPSSSSTFHPSFCFTSREHYLQGAKRITPHHCNRARPTPNATPHTQTQNPPDTYPHHSPHYSPRHKHSPSPPHSPFPTTKPPPKTLAPWQHKHPDK